MNLPASTLPAPTSPRAEGNSSGPSSDRSSAGDRGAATDCQPINSPPSIHEDAVAGGHPTGRDVALLARLIADALKDSIDELRKEDETRMSWITTTFQGELLAFRKGEEKRLARFENAIANLKPAKTKTDPTTHFWTAYKKVADEHDNDIVSKYVGDLDTSLLFAGLFSAITSAFIVQIIPQLQPNPTDLTNVLLLRILQQNTSFGGADPLAPVSNISISIVRAQSILFASLAVTLFVAFIAVLGKQWILYYTRATTWGNIVDRGKERQAKLAGLRKWGFHLIMESLPVMLQFALLLFGIALTVYLWDLDVSIAEVVLVVTSAGFAFYAFIVVTATIWKDCPFQTPLSVLLPQALPWTKEFITLIRVWLRHWLKPRAVTLLHRRIKLLKKHGGLTNALGRVFGILLGGTADPTPLAEDVSNTDYQMTLSNPAFWRQDPLYTSPVSKDISASAGFWLLENSTDFSAATAFAAVFSQFQWPSHHPSSTALVRLRDTYVECFRAHEPKKTSRIKALQTAAAYYVLYHTQLAWSTWKGLEVEVEKLPPDLPLDLLLQHEDEWDGDDVFEYLLHVDAEDRSEPVKSARFLSYIAPYWFCGDSDATVKFRPNRLQTLNELAEVLEKSRALNPATITNCMLCAGAAVDFPLHPEDLIRVDKSDYFVSTFKLVVEHIHGVALGTSQTRRRRYAKTALEILHTLVKKSTPSFDTAWMNDLLLSASQGEMVDETFTALLRLNALRKVDDAVAESEIPSGNDYDHIRQSETDSWVPEGFVTWGNPTPEYTLLDKLLRNVKTCGAQKGGWEDDAVYGGLIAIRDIPGLRFYIPRVEFIETLSKAMEKWEDKGESKQERPFRVRKAAYDVVLAARDGWLKAPDLRQTLEEIDFPKKLHSVIAETYRPDHQRSFLEMMEILSEDRYWHPYLRNAIDIWLPLRHEGPDCALRILTNVGELLLPKSGGYKLDKSLEKVVEDEWAAVPGRHPTDLTPERLEPLAKVTEQFKRLSFFSESERKAVLAAVEQVLPSLEMRRDCSSGGVGEELSPIIDQLLKILFEPIQPNSRKSTFW